MRETRKTSIYCAVALVLVLLVMVSAPKRITPSAFLDQGETFYPEFTDPNVAQTLEVIDYDEETGAAVPFKVTFSKKGWTIPSHHNYSADAKDRLASTAAGVIGMAKDDFRSDNVSDHERCGVIDPLEEVATSLKGRGQRVTIKGENDVVLADLIIGDKIEGSENFRFVRVPGQKRVYASRVDFDISTRFGDWIEADLLQMAQDQIDRIVIKDYSINERTGQIDQRDVVVLEKVEEEWQADRMARDEKVDQNKIKVMLRTLDDLKIVGVRPKPEGLTASLTQSSSQQLPIGNADVLSLRSKGYFFTRDGQLVSNEGELQAGAFDGVQYTLRFGEVVYGSGLAVTAGTGGGEDDERASGENRYLFVTTRFDASLFPEPNEPPNTDFLEKPDSLRTEADHENRSLHAAHQRWREKIDRGMKRSHDLNARFAGWYYVISAESFEKLRMTRRDLIKTQ
jgi:hypothetical protein